MKELRDCSYRTIRQRLAAKLGIPVAYNVHHRGLYMYDYGSHIRVRLYGHAMPDGKREKIFEEDVPRKDFPPDELISKLMLLAGSV